MTCVMTQEVMTGDYPDFQMRYPMGENTYYTEDCPDLPSDPPDDSKQTCYAMVKIVYVVKGFTTGTRMSGILAW